MTTRYLEFADAQSLDAKVAELDAAYMDDMRKQLGRADSESIDQEYIGGELVGFTRDPITTRFVDTVTSKTEAGGLIVVEASAETYLTKGEVLVSKEALPAKWQAELPQTRL